MSDLIDRQAALDAIKKLEKPAPTAQHLSAIFDCEDTIKALPSAQPSVSKTEIVGDVISRKAAIETVRKAKSIGQAHRMLLQLPSAQPGWIPWDSGKFPEESGTYTVTAYDGATKRVTYAKYQKRLKRWELTGSRAYWRVLAWMPLPTPYREGGQDG